MLKTLQNSLFSTPSIKLFSKQTHLEQNSQCHKQHFDGQLCNMNTSEFQIECVSGIQRVPMSNTNIHHYIQSQSSS